MDLITAFLLILVLAFLCEYVDTALGGGYGTIIVPVLIIAGFATSKELVPMILITEIISGSGSALLHHRAGNATFQLKLFSNTRDPGLTASIDTLVSIILASCGVFGAVIAAVISTRLPVEIITTYISFLVFAVGAVILLGVHWRFTWKRIFLIGSVAAFNKGISGGGYGPLVTAGQVILNRDARNAVASTSLAEAAVCAAGLAIYILQGGLVIKEHILFSMILGSLAALPIAVQTVKKFDTKKLRPLVGAACIVLGFTLFVKMLAGL